MLLVIGRMIEPILVAGPRRRRAFTVAAAVAFTLAMESPASADGASERGRNQDDGRCALGLVLNVSDATANDIASAVCSAARTRQVSGNLRVGVVQASRLAVTVARVDPNGTEQVMRLDATDANDAIQRAPNLIAPWAAAPPPAEKPAPKVPFNPLAPPANVNSGQPKVTGGHSEVTSGDIGSDQRSHSPKAAGIDALEPNAAPAADEPAGAVEQPPPADVVPKPQTQESLSKPRLIPGLILGAHGAVSVSKVSSGVATGGGVSVGLGDEHVQGLADFTYAQNEEGTPSSFRHVLLTGGARMVVGDSIVRPAFGGGWSISHFEAGRPQKVGHAEGGGLGVYGEVGLFIVPSKGHEIGAIARMNLPLYSGNVMEARSYSGGTYNSSRDDLAPVQFTFLAAYVHPFK